MSNVELELYTDSAGGIGKGCAAYLQGKWAYLKWPKEWSGTDILRDMTEALVVAIYRRRLKARPAGNAFAQNTNEPHIDCNSFNVTFFL
jgi:hypothetical protein